MRISDWSSDVCSSDLAPPSSLTLSPTLRICRLMSQNSGLAMARHPMEIHVGRQRTVRRPGGRPLCPSGTLVRRLYSADSRTQRTLFRGFRLSVSLAAFHPTFLRCPQTRSEEHTSELQSLMRISYAVFCLKKKKHRQ